jgi:DnaJ homolog subfamily B member 4
LYGEAGIDAGVHGPDAGAYGFGGGSGGTNPYFGGGATAGGDGRSNFQSFFSTGHDGAAFQQRSFNFGGFGGGGGAGPGANIDLSDLLRGMFGGQRMDLGSMGGAGGPFSQQQDRSTSNHRKQKSYQRKIRCTLEDLATGKTKKVKVTFGNLEKIYSVPIKPGWKAGTKITYGGSQRPGGIPTMVFVVEEVPHKYLKRDGNDLIYICWLSEDQRQGGIRIKVPLPTGETWKRTFPREETPSSFITDGQRVIVENQGMPIKGGPERGNLIVEFRVRPS